MRIRNAFYALAALASLAPAEGALAQGANAIDEDQVLISQVQADKRAVVLRAMQLTDAEVAEFAPLYDEYQAEMKAALQDAATLLGRFASNYESMTDESAKSILEDWLDLRDRRNDIVRKYARKLGRKLPATDVLRWVQIENKLNSLLDIQAARVIPVALK